MSWHTLSVIVGALDGGEQMSMPSFHTIPKEVECAALLSDVYMCMGVSDRVFVISQCACRAIYFKKPCIQLFSHIFWYRDFLSRIFEKGSAAIYGPCPHKRSHFISLTRASRCTPQLCSFLFLGRGFPFVIQSFINKKR